MTKQHAGLKTQSPKPLLSQTSTDPTSILTLKTFRTSRVPSAQRSSQLKVPNASKASRLPLPSPWPWLDGSRAPLHRSSSISVPGAFMDENVDISTTTPPPVEGAAPIEVHSQTHKELSATKSSQDCKGVPANMPNQVEDRVTHPIRDSPRPDREAHLHGIRHMSQQSRSDSSGETPSTQIHEPDERGVSSVLEIARQLNRTDSSLLHNHSESSADDRRHLVTGLTYERYIVSPAPRHLTTYRFDQGSPTPSNRSSTHLQPAETAPPSRRVSLALQPLRRVTMSEDDARSHQAQGSLIQRSERLRSISIQPIRNQKDPVTDQKPAKQKTPRARYSEKDDPAQVGQALRDSIAGMESLMQEAVRLARIAAEHEPPSEIPILLEGAKYALRRSSEVQEAVRSRQPSSVDSNHSSSSTSSSSSSESSSEDSEDLSLARVEPLAVIEPAVIRSPSFQVPAPTRANTQNAASSPTRSHLQRHNTTQIPPETSVDLSSSRAIDWAYPNEGFSMRDNLSNLAPRYRTFSRPNNQPQRRVTFRGSEDHSRQPSSEFTTDVNCSRATPQEASRQDDRLTSSNPNQPHNSKNLMRERGSVSLHDGLEEQDSVSPDLQLPPRSTTENWGRDKYDEDDFVEKDYIETDKHGLKGKHHISLRDGQKFSLHKGYKRQPIARNWSIGRKRWAAAVACINTSIIGLLIGIYAGEVPAIQYALADENHHVILGNVAFYCGIGLTTFLFWPLPLLHGRKPYTLLAIAIALPLQFPQALVVSVQHNSSYSGYRVGLLLARAMSGLVLGFAHINFMPTLLDLFGASLQSNQPHGEIVILNDIRRHGGGMGLWLGTWAWTFIASISIGFLVGAEIISGLNPSWGFYICVILLAIMLFFNVITPETRRSPHRRTMQEVELPNDSISRRVARGEIKMHVSGDGPKWWWEEVSAGIYLCFRMIMQSGFLVMAIYLAWIYAEIVLIIVLLGNLLSKEYQFRPQFVGLGVLSIAIGALLAVPNSKANLFSRSRKAGPRTDSMTFQPRLSWTSHLVRRAIFMITLPLAGIAYTLASRGTSISYMAPITFAGVIGYISNLAIAECNGIIMEAFDTSDLQPGANSRHRLQSLAPETKRKRTTYSSYPRVTAGMFVSQSLGFFFAAAATGVGGAVTRHVGAQKATAITAGILLGLTILLTCILWRFKSMQVIPNELFGHYFGSKTADRKTSTTSIDSTKSWRAVIIGNPSGKTRRMSWLELGSLSRWTEIRRLNRLLSRSTTQALNPGWR